MITQLFRWSPRVLSGLFTAGLLSCGLSATLAQGPFELSKFQVQQQQGPAAELGSASVVQPKRPLSLNYRSTPWEKVLKDLTESSGHTLVMKTTPPGRYSRRDGNQYSFAEALRVLNHSLEKDGFRLLEQGQYLILIEVKELRTKYERSPIPRQTGVLAHATSAEPIPVPSYPRNFTPIAQQPGDRVPNYPTIAQVEFEQPADPPVLETPPEPSPIVQAELTPRHSALDVAKLVHESYGEKSRLLKSGPQGLPAFEIQYADGSATESSKRLAVGIDIEKNRLVVEAPEPAVRQFEQTIKLIEHAVEAGEDETIRIVPSKQDVERVAKQLGPPMNRLLALQTPRETNPQTTQPGTTQPELTPGGRGIFGAQQPATDPTDPSATPGPLGARLRSDVTVQAMPELGVLLIQGNEADVQAITNVIKEIEKLSIGSAPSIEILPLNHVDSTQLATLLTSVYSDLGERLQTAVPGQPAVSTARTRVTFIAVSKPNAIVILAPEAEMPSIIETAKQLDQPVDPDTEFEVFPLKSAIASQAATLLTEFFADREGLGGSITAFADVRTNSLIVRARPRDLEEAASLIEKIDSDASGAVNKLKVIPLKNAVAQEVADVLNEVLQVLILPPGQSSQTAGAAFNFAGTGQSSTQLREIKSLAVEFLSSKGGKNELLRSGILADVRITADSRINSLIITAPERSMKLMEALIDELDLIPSSVAEIKVFTLRNADATQAVDLLTALFTQTTGGGVGANAQQAQGLQIAGATDVSNALVSLRFSADIRTNSVIAVGGADSLRVVDAILLRLDEDGLRERQFTTIRLKNTPAEDVAAAITGFLDQQRSLSDSQPGLISNIQLLEQEIIVVPEAITNSLIVSATPRYFSIIKSMVARLDQAPPQVIIQALLVEVGLDNTDEFGMEIGLQDSILFDRSVVDAMTGGLSPGFLFNTPNLGNAPGTTGTDTVGGQSLSSFGVGRSNTDLGFGGLVLSASSENISVLIRALAARRHVHILSRPQIRTLDNQQAQIQVGQQVPIVNGVNITTQGLANPQVEQQEVGIILTVRPRINPDGTIVMETAAVKSQLTGEGVPIFVQSDGATIESPIIDITSANATVSIPNGHTVVLGGMITERDETIERKVPWLGDVPILGRAFRFDSTRAQRTELLIFLTPRVILNDADSEFIKQVETERTHIIEEQVEETHGPIFAVPPADIQPSIQHLPTNGPIQLPDGSWLQPPDQEQSSIQQPGQGKSFPVAQAGNWQNVPPTTLKPVASLQQAQYIQPAASTSKPAPPQQTTPKPKRKLWPFK